MKRPIDLARKYLALADRDIKVFLKLIDDPEIDDEPVGFHAQQAMEKCLKAVLAYHRVEFRRTRDLKDLLGTFQDANLPLPPFADQIHILNPFAVASNPQRR
ncbi:MAG: HEPN domain-containing protein [Nitrospinae bacterium]|nr:HEPN domain-containing protein [Nitrospinota bacterium]